MMTGENVLTYKNGKERYYKSASDTLSVDFGKCIGSREAARLNLIECESCYQSLGVPNVETFFGTSPPIWNKLFVLMATVIPQAILQNRVYMDIFARISLPMVRLVDRLVGSKNGEMIATSYYITSYHTISYHTMYSIISQRNTTLQQLLGWM